MSVSTTGIRRLSDSATEFGSPDLAATNLERLRDLFPEAFADGALDLEVLAELVGVDQAEGGERYGLNWHGKRRARQLALSPSMGTLLPVPDESIDWETTKNLVIEGDNLEVLKLLQRGYSGRVKLIYIDPPYNTGKDFVYRDDFNNSIRNYQRLTGQLDSKGRRTSTNIETSGRFHTDWLNMIYPRLKLARTLLRPDGVILVSIDDNEDARLRLVLDEIFGAENRLASLVWSLGAGPTAGHFTRSHETILCYARDRSMVPNFVWRGGGTIRASALKRISRSNPASDITFPAGIEYEGEDRSFTGLMGGEVTQEVVDGKLEFRDGRLVRPVTLRAGWAMRNQIESWVSGRETYDSKGQRVKRFYFSRRGLLMYEKERSVVNPRTVLSDLGSTAHGTIDLTRLGLPKGYFDFPKPVSLISYLVKLITAPDESAIVLDFFAGSGTTAHAVISANAEEGGDRRFITVQLPEATPGHEFGTLSEFTRERVRRALQSVGGVGGLRPEAGGFRVFRLAESNLRPWSPDPSDLEGTLHSYTDPILAGRTDEDILYELTLKLGLDLTGPIEERKIVGHRVLSAGSGRLFLCLSTSISGTDAGPLSRGIADWYRELGQTEAATSIFRDSAFEDDVSKTNLSATLREQGLTNVRSL